MFQKQRVGEGFSAVVANLGVLITMNRDGDDDVVSALLADEGTQVWEHRYTAPTREGNSLRYGKGPNATPLLLADRVVTGRAKGVLIDDHGMSEADATRFLQKQAMNGRQSVGEVATAVLEGRLAP